MRDSFDALRERQFRLLFTGQIVSLLGDAITGVALAFAVLDLTGSARPTSATSSPRRLSHSSASCSSVASSRTGCRGAQ
jgi:hypothetical protein